MKKANIIKPHLSVMDRKQIKRVHEYSLQILSSVGLRVDSTEARKLYTKAIGPQAVDGDRVRIPPDLVEWAIQAAPARIDICDRKGVPAFRLPDQTRFGVGVTSLYYQEPETDAVLPFTRKHMEICVRLGNDLLFQQSALCRTLQRKSRICMRPWRWLPILPNRSSF